MSDLIFFSDKGIKKYSKEEILVEMLALLNSAGIDTNSNSVTRVFANLVSGSVVDMVSAMYEIYLSRNPLTAKGIHLDNIIVDKQLLRMPEKKSFMSVEIDFNNPVVKQVLADEIIFEHPYGGFFENVSFQMNNDIKQTVVFQAKSFGKIGNVPILPNAGLILIKGDDIESFSQKSIGAGGADRETDEEVRARYFNETIEPYSTTALTKKLKEIDGIINARIFFNRSKIEEQDVAPRELGIAITTRGTYDDDPAVDWSENVKQAIWNCLTDNFDFNVITSSKDAYLIKYPHEVNEISYYVKPMLYVTTTSIKVHLKGIFPRDDIFVDALTKEEMTKIGDIVLKYAQDNISNELTALDIIKVVSQELIDTIAYKTLQGFIKNIEISFLPIKDGEVGGKIDLNENTAIVIANSYRAVSTYAKQEIPHVEVVLHDV